MSTVSPLGWDREGSSIKQLLCCGLETVWWAVQDRVNIRHK